MPRPPATAALGIAILAAGEAFDAESLLVAGVALSAVATCLWAWCGIAGVPVAGILAAAELGLDLERTLLVPDLGDAWP